MYVHDVPIEFLNEDTSLADKGLMRISGDEDITVDLKLQMPRNVVYDFDTSELRLVSDLSTITYAGKQSVSYTILYPSKVSSSSNKKDIEIRCKVVGNVAEGYIAGTIEMLPETLEVRGQQTDIMQISYAQITLDIENASSTVVELLDYELYDFNDQPVENKNIHPMSESVQVTMPVLKVKDVPLQLKRDHKALRSRSAAATSARKRSSDALQLTRISLERSHRHRRDLVTARHAARPASDLEAIYGARSTSLQTLSDIAADSGSYTVPARIEVSGYDVGAVGTYEVTVHIS